jgi:tetratricopeptide (TPR) repeat protein
MSITPPGKTAAAEAATSGAELFSTAVKYHQAGQWAEAEAGYRRVLDAQPNHPDALHLLGIIAHQMRRDHNLALELIDKALALKPSADAVNNRGNALQELKRYEEALASYDEAVSLKPDFAQAFNNRGVALQELRRLDEALSSYDKALALRPDYAEAYNKRGYALHDLNRLDEALASYDKALALKPDLAEAFNNQGVTLQQQNRIDEALASYREALRLGPNFAQAHSNLGYALLLAGRFEEGWKEHEWRWKTEHMSGDARDFPVPLWRGEAIGDRVILLYAEQGFGDTLQFCRYAPLIAAGARTVLEVQAPLVRLLSRLPGLTAVVARGDRLPPFDLHCPLLNLPRAFGTTLDTIPAATPYLAADPARAADWRRRLDGLGGLRVGLVWAGGARMKWQHLAVDRRRSIALDTLASLGEAPGVSFISLQKGGPAAQAANPLHGMALHDFTADLHDFDDTAALIDGLDLVISVDTAVAHLAGALGKPVWLLNRFDSCWRWLRNRDDSPWYPLLRQFRQPSPGDWNSVIRSTRDALQHLAAGNRDQLRPRDAGSRSVPEIERLMKVRG